MNWDDYEAVWKRQPLPKGAVVDVNELRRTFETKSRKLEATIRVRDYTEAGAGVVVAVAYAFFWAKLGATAWPMGLAMGLVLGLSAFFIRERLRARQWRVGPAAPLLVKVEADIAVLQRQCRLVETLWRWYLGPVVGAVVIQGWVIQRTIVRQSPPWSLQRDPRFLAGTILFLLLAFWFAWWINQRALRHRLRPRLTELEKLRDELRAEETPGLTTADRR